MAGEGVNGASHVENGDESVYVKAADFFNPIYKQIKEDAEIPLPIGNSVFELNTSWWMAKFSQLVYQENYYVREALESLEDGTNYLGDKDRLVFFENGDTEAFLMKFANLESPFAVLAFRGTENDYLDIFKDITIFKRPMRIAKTSKTYKVHGGFLSALQHVWGMPDIPETEKIISENIGRTHGIINVLSRPEYKDIPLYVTGHSLGGALATLAALKIHDSPLLTNNLKAVYTFGSPRVFEKQGAEDYPEEIPNYRIVYGDDLVTYLPFAFGFRHTKGLHKLKPTLLIEKMDNPTFDALKTRVTDTMLEEKPNREDNDAGLGSFLQLWKFCCTFIIMRSFLSWRSVSNEPLKKLLRETLSPQVRQDMEKLSLILYTLWFVIIYVISYYIYVILAFEFAEPLQTVPYFLYADLALNAMLVTFSRLLLSLFTTFIFANVYGLFSVSLVHFSVKGFRSLFIKKDGVNYNPSGTKHHMLEGYVNSLELNYHTAQLAKQQNTETEAQV